MAVPLQIGTVTTKAKEVFRAAATANINGSNSTDIAYPEIFDPSGCYNPANGRFTPSRAGYYRLRHKLIISEASATTTYVAANICKNGSGVEWSYNAASNQSNIDSPEVEAIVYANGTGDYFTAQGYRSTFSLFTVLGASAGYYSVFEGEMISGDYAGSFATPKVRAYRSSNQAITTGTSTAVSFDSTRHNAPLTMWNSGQPTRLVAPVSGVYSIFWQIIFEASTSGTYRQVMTRVNGSLFVADDIKPPTAAPGYARGAGSTDHFLAAGDYVEIIVAHDRGSNLNLLNANNYGIEAGMHLIRDDAAVPASMEAWTAVGSGGSTFGTNITDGGTHTVAAFRKDPFGRVQMKGRGVASGALSAGTLGTIVCTLPTGYRPATNQMVPCVMYDNSAATYLACVLYIVAANGQVEYFGNVAVATGDNIYLEAVAFDNGV